MSKRFLSFALVLCILLSSVTMAVPASAKTAPAAPIQVVYDIDQIGAGAEGTVTVTLPAGHGADDIYLYWGDAEGKLQGYSALAPIKVSGSVVSTRMPVGTFIPEEATRLLAYGSSDEGGFSEGFAAAELPQGAAIDLNGFGELITEFQAVSDMHITRTNASRFHHSDHMVAMLEDIKKISPDSIGIFTTGDSVDRATDADYEEFVRIVEETADEPTIYAGFGNHELFRHGTVLPDDKTLADYSEPFYSYLLEGVLPEDTSYAYEGSLSYAFERDGYKFIFLGPDTLDLTWLELNSTTLAWLEAELNNAPADQPTFVIMHQAMSDSVSGTFAGSSSSNEEISWGQVYPETAEALNRLFADHPELVLFTGHTHWELDEYSTYYPRDSRMAHTFGCSSVGYTGDAYDVISTKSKVGSEGYYVYVYGDTLVVRGRDFLKGEWLSAAQFVVDLSDPAPAATELKPPLHGTKVPLLTSDGATISGTLKVFLPADNRADAIGLFFADADTGALSDTPFASVALKDSVSTAPNPISFGKVSLPATADYIVVRTYSRTLGWSVDCDVIKLSDYDLSDYGDAATYDATVPTPTTPMDFGAIASYDRITGTEHNGIITPDENIYFFDPDWSTAPTLDANGQFEYTYGNTTWGNGKTYLLTWGKNAFATFAELVTAVEVQAKAWADKVAGTPQDAVCVLAPATIGEVVDFDLAAPVAEPTPDELLNVYMLGAQAGRNPVNPDRDTKADVKVIKNNRSTDSTTETVLTDTFRFPAYADITLDGFAGTAAASLLSQGKNQYTDISVYNYFVRDLTGPQCNMTFDARDNGGKELTQTMWEFKNCYFDWNVAMVVKSGTTASAQNQIVSNKVIFDNCAFLHGVPPKAASSSDPRGHEIFLLPGTDTSVSKTFFGYYAEHPEQTFRNCVAADWQTRSLIRLGNDNTRFRSYENNVVQINVVDNHFYDVYGLKNPYNCGVIEFNKWSSEAAEAAAYTMNILDNVFVITDDALDNSKKTRYTYMINNSAAPMTMQHKINIVGNVFQFPNQTPSYDSKNFIYHPMYGKFTACRIDLSGNLFLDNQNNVLPANTYAWRYGGPLVESDVYASGAMRGGMREMMSPKEIKDGAVLYSYIHLDRSSTTVSKFNNMDYFLGAITVLLERGKTYPVNDELFRFGDDRVKLVGVYTEQDCTNEVTELTQDTVNGKYAKVTFSETTNGITTTATVVFALNTPSKYIIIAPEDSDYYKNKSYTFNSMTYTEAAAAEDGVTAQFFTALGSDALDAVGQTYCEATTKADSYTLGDTATAESFGMQNIVVFTPGYYDFDSNADFSHNLGHRSVAMVGPKWNTSPFGDENAEGKVAGGRTEDTTQEAVIAGYMRVNNGTLPCTYTFHGLVFTECGANSSISINAASTNVGSLYHTINVKNCLFKNSSERLIQGNHLHTADNNKIHDVFVTDCVFDGTAQDRRGVEDRLSLFHFRANFTTIENFAVLDQYCVPEEVLSSINPINDDQVKWNPATELLTTKNVIFYSQKHCDAREVTNESQQPTCVAGGKAVYTCTMCKKESEQILDIDLDAHIWEEEYTVDVEPTFETEGSKSYHCVYCDSMDADSVVILPALCAAFVDGKAYDSLEAALSAAKEGDTVKLNSDAAMDYITIAPAVRLDLNGKTLTADYIVGFKGSALIDGSKDNSGKLIIKKDHLALDTANDGYLPVYETNGYIFTTVTLEGRSTFLSATEFTFSPMFETFVHDALLQGEAQSGVSIVIRLNWREEGNYEAEQDFTYLDQMVQTVIGSYNAEGFENNYGRAFTASFDGSEASQAEKVTVTAVVISDTGVEIAGAPATFAEV